MPEPSPLAQTNNVFVVVAVAVVVVVLFVVLPEVFLGTSAHTHTHALFVSSWTILVALSAVLILQVILVKQTSIWQGHSSHNKSSITNEK